MVPEKLIKIVKNDLPEESHDSLISIRLNNVVNLVDINKIDDKLVLR